VRRVGLVARKSRWRKYSIDSSGDLMLVDGGGSHMSMYVSSLNGIYVFAADATTGLLAPVPGSPFPVTLDVPRESAEPCENLCAPGSVRITELLAELVKLAPSGQAMNPSKVRRDLWIKVVKRADVRALDM
jgi:hypothetical protein